VPVVVETLNRCELGYQVHFASMFFAFAPQTLCKVLIHSFANHALQNEGNDDLRTGNRALSSNAHARSKLTPHPAK